MKKKPAADDDTMASVAANLHANLYEMLGGRYLLRGMNMSLRFRDLPLIMDLCMAYVLPGRSRYRER